MAKTKNNEELVSKWMDIVAAVFNVDTELQDHEPWKSRFANVNSLSPDERVEMADEYLRAVAERVIERYGAK